MDIEEIILGYENEFFKKEFCNNIENLNNRIHDDFTEFGQSGRVYNKGGIISYLNNVDSNRNIEILDFKIKDMGNGLLIANYMTHNRDLGIKSLRTSIWVKENSNWKLYFHQGTKTSDYLIRSQNHTINADIILSKSAKKQLKRYGLTEDEFLMVADLEDIANEESSRKHNIIFPIEIGGKKYIVSGKKHKKAINIDRIEKNNINI